MSPESYSWEVRENAEELYIIDGLTYAQVAQRCGVSVSQLKRWGTEATPSWSERRRAYRAAQSSVRHNVTLARARLIEAVIESEDPQKAFAFNALVNASQALEKEARARLSDQQAEPVVPTTDDPEELVQLLHQALIRKIFLLLEQPGGITLSAVKELSGVLKLLQPAEEKGEKKAGFNQEQLAAIRQALEGM